MYLFFFCVQSTYLLAKDITSYVHLVNASQSRKMASEKSTILKLHFHNFLFNVTCFIKTLARQSDY